MKTVSCFLKLNSFKKQDIHYPAGKGFCGLKSAVIVLATCGKIFSDPKKILKWSHRIQRLTMPQDIISILKHSDIKNVGMRHAHKPDRQIIKDLIDADCMIILLRRSAHWILIVGYDDQKQEFIAFDSKRVDNKTVLVQAPNTIISFEEFPKVWKTNFFVDWAVGGNYLYISVPCN